MSQRNPYYLSQQNEMQNYNRHQDHNIQPPYNYNQPQQQGYQYQQGYQPPQYQQPYFHNQPMAPQYRQQPQIIFNPSTRTDHCPYCNDVTQSFEESKYTWFAWLTCFILFWLTFVLFWLPFVFDACKEKQVKCVRCHKTKFVIKNC